MAKFTDLWNTINRFRVISLILAIIFFSSLLLISRPDAPKWESHPSNFGTLDFVAYWSAFQAVKAGENPYLLSSIYPFQGYLIADQKPPQAFLNPPWSLAVLAPVLALDFTAARFLWIALNILFVYATVVLVSKYLHGPPSQQISLLISATLFLPSFWCIWLGQLSLFMTFSFTAAFAAILQKRDRLAGLLLIPLTLKPHLFLVIGIVIGVYILYKKRFSLITSFLAGFVTLQLITYLFVPHIYTQWVEIEFSPLNWKTSSLVTFLREAIIYSSGELVAWPAIAVPVIGIALSVPWYLRRINDIKLEWVVPPLLCISLGIAPYVWLHDFSLLLICQATLLVLMERIKPPAASRIQIIAMLVMLQLCIVIGGSLTQGLQFFFWIPWVMLVIWFQSCHLLHFK